MKDFLGTEIKTGQHVVYPNRQGASLWMNKGIVTDLTQKNLKVRRVPNNKYEKPQIVTITKIDRVVVVPSAAF